MILNSFHIREFQTDTNETRWDPHVLCHVWCRTYENIWTNDQIWHAFCSSVTIWNFSENTFCHILLGSPWNSLKSQFREPSSPFNFPPSLHLLNLFLNFSCLLGSRATVFWDHMTISQSCPPPLPMCSSPHGVASPAQSRPALWMPPTLPCPPRRTTSSATSQVHPGLKVHQPQEAEQRHVHMANKAETSEVIC